MKIYLDLCCFNRPFDNQDDDRIRLETEAKLTIQDWVRKGDLQLVWSYMLIFENDANTKGNVRNHIELWAQLASDVILASTTILQRAGEYVNHGIGSKDALHIACAIEAQAALFITTDRGILRKRDRIDGIKIINPLEIFLEEKNL